MSKVSPARAGASTIQDKAFEVDQVLFNMRRALRLMGQLEDANLVNSLIVRASQESKALLYDILEKRDDVG